MKANKRRPDDLVIVDENLDDYDLLVSEHHQLNPRINLYTTGEGALQSAVGSSSTVWLINIRLPDMTGIHLLGLVRRRLRRCGIFLVGDEYSATDELDARLAGATAYVCKPASAAWLETLRPRYRSQAIRAGPQLSS